MNSIQGPQRPAAARRRPGPSAWAPRLAPLCAALLVVAGCQRSQPPAGAAPAQAAEKASVEGEGVSLKPDEIEKAGIKTTPAAAARQAPESTGYALVLTRDAIAQAVADITSAAAAERQSRAVLLRSNSLAGTPGAMAVEVQEAAQRQATVDAAALALAERRMSATFGRDAPWKDDYASPVLAALASGQSKLVRVSFPLGALGPTVPAKLRLLRIGPAQAAKSFESDAVWSAPADASLPGRSFFAILKGSDVSEGERLLARAPVGAAVAGVIVPAAAVLIRGGKYWCYVEETPGHYVRKEIDISMPTDDGYFVAAGIAAGANIVTASAGELLAREVNPGSAAD
ncbi:MAG TPA: hypothetical protein VKT54_11680 [Steroidobacteraceae bacterium]|nr:hypothetical protein [Steroidobacteraceae bacterium]